jgi:hypothetical protein
VWTSALGTVATRTDLDVVDEPGRQPDGDVVGVSVGSADSDGVGVGVVDGVGVD